MKILFIRIGGKVQGVGFRYFAMLKAIELNIMGWVKNTNDGMLEIEAMGDPEQMILFVDWMKIGPARAVIQSFNISEIHADRKFKGFIIK